MLKPQDIPEQLIIIIKKPIKKEYHADNTNNHCAPIINGEGCYGDCSDCYTNHVHKYARALKQQNINITESINELIDILYEKI